MRRSPWALGALLALGAMVGPRALWAQASPYVPVGDPAYRDLDALVVRGLVGGLVLGQRPYSRLTFARAAEAVRGAPGATARDREAAARLQARFSGEAESPAPDTAAGAERPRGYAAIREIATHAAAADAPPRGIRTQLKSGVDADVNPLLQRNQGRVLADGWTWAGEGTAEAAAGRVAVSVRPRAWVAGGVAEATLAHAYARAVLGNLSVEAGRNALVHGHGVEGGVALSGNARALDLLRVSMERPGRLPWILRALGPAAFSATVADMGRDQDTPGSKLVVLQGSVRPHANLELGGAVLNHQGGGVGPDVGFFERLRDALLLVKRRPFYLLPASDVHSDKAVAVDARLTLPGPGVEAWVEVLTTDDHDLFYKTADQALWNDAAWTGGARVLGLGAEGRLDLWVEASRVGLLPYTHHEFTSGMAVDRRILGNPLGPLGTGFAGGVRWNAPDATLSFSGAWERYSGDTYRNPDDGLSRRYRVADNPDEIRVRAVADWTRGDGGAGLRWGARVGWERVTRFALGSQSRTNAVAQTWVGWGW